MQKLDRQAADRAAIEQEIVLKAKAASAAAKRALRKDSVSYTRGSREDEQRSMSVCSRPQDSQLLLRCSRCVGSNTTRSEGGCATLSEQDAGRQAHSFQRKRQPCGG